VSLRGCSLFTNAPSRTAASRFRIHFAHLPATASRPFIHPLTRYFRRSKRAFRGTTTVEMSSSRTFIRALTGSSPTSRSIPARSSTTAYRIGLSSRQNHLRPVLLRSIVTSSNKFQAEPVALSSEKGSSASPSTSTTNVSTSTTPSLANLKSGQPDQSSRQAEEGSSRIDWTTSFHGLSETPFSNEAAAILLHALDPGDVEIKPDGIVYLPEIKYRRILNKAFGPGGWGLAPRGETSVTAKSVTREYALLAHGRFVGTKLAS
jgi:hypothetical protein